MAERPERLRRRLLGSVSTLLHRAAMRLVPRGRARGEAGGRVYFLLEHAWGMGGTIRTTLNVAGELAKTREVEVISLLRRREGPAFRLPGDVRVTALDDRRSGRRGLLDRVP